MRSEVGKLLGYVVHLPASDEFLAKTSRNIMGIEGWLWSKAPELAFLYPTLRVATAVAKRHGPNCVAVELWDRGFDYYVQECP
ncbi:MAG: hypothetical protein AAGG55_02850 [Pseudomonadota bacterium]